MKFQYKSDRNGNGCSTVYPPSGSRDRVRRGKGALGRVCYRGGGRDARWLAAVQPVAGAQLVKATGKTRDAAVADALASAPTVPDELRTLPEVAEATGIPRRTLLNWIQTGRLTTYGQRQRVHVVRCADVIDAADSLATKILNRRRARKCR